jgi:hypothetical protein
VWRCLHDLRAARADADIATRLDPGQARAWLARAWVEHDERDFVQSTHYALEALALWRQNSCGTNTTEHEIRALLGRLPECLGSLDKLDVFERQALIAELGLAHVR